MRSVEKEERSARPKKKESKALDEELRRQCQCPSCPTYTIEADGKKELLYCFWGDSDCITKRRSCICPTCKVWQVEDFEDTFFCLKGPEIVRREKPH